MLEDLILTVCLALTGGAIVWGVGFGFKGAPPLQWIARKLGDPSSDL